MKHILPFIFAVLLATRVAAAAPAAAGHETAAERPPSPFSTAPERVKALNIALPSIRQPCHTAREGDRVVELVRWRRDA